MARPTSSLPLLLALVGATAAACDGGPQRRDDDDGAGDDDSFPSDDDAADDDAADDDTSPLGPCESRVGKGDHVLLRGTLALPVPVIDDGWVLYSRSSGLISCVGTDCDARPEAADASVVCTDGVVTPGLIDAHNHVQYNTLPFWRTDELYDNRYGWQGDPDYWDFSEALDALGSYDCEVMKWGEARVLVGGGTSVMGNIEACTASMVRNLDNSEASSGIPNYTADYYSGRITNVDGSDAADLAADLESGALDAYLPHISEGVGGTVRDEFDTLEDLGLAVPGVAVIHGTDLVTSQLATMAAAGMTLVWSPRSNLGLYGRTTPVAEARNVGLPVALGPDWTPSGSFNVREELACAAHYNGRYLGSAYADSEILEMATTTAARAVGLDAVAGQLAEGFLADLTVVRGDRDDPYRAVFDAGAEDVALVVVGGDALFGDPGLLQGIEPNEYCESLDVCGTARTVCVQRDASGDYGDSLQDIEATLQGALDQAASEAGIDASHPLAYSYVLGELFQCGEPLDAGPCDPVGGLPSGDADQDGVADGEDGCPDAYDPEQGDLDGDGLGDACDPCALDPDLGCEAPAPADLDGDGVADEEDNCPRDSNPGQEDSDADGKGDACDSCPDQPNPGLAPCSLTIPQIRDPSAEGHPAEGEAVAVSGVVVIAVVVDGNGGGFWVRDPEVEDFGALHVYVYGPPEGVEIGDVVDVEGIYDEYYGQTEIVDPTWTVTGTAPVPDPIPVEAADVATGGPRAEALESQLVVVDGPIEVVDANPDEPAEYDEFVVTGGLRVDDQIWDYPFDPEVGDPVGFLRGVLTYSYDDSKVLPRGEDDLVIE